MIPVEIPLYMKKVSEEFKKQLEDMAKNSTTMVSNEKTMEIMGKRGEKVEKRFISYEEYIDELFKGNVPSLYN